MNKAQKKIVNDAISSVEQLISKLQGVQSDLQDEYDGKSDRWREGDKGEEMQDHLNSLDSAIDNLEDAKNDLDSLGAGE